MPLRILHVIEEKAKYGDGSLLIEINGEYYVMLKKGVNA
jgi:hypothetical protein